DGLCGPDFSPTRPVLQRGTPPQKEEFFPDRCWAIQVMPSFRNWGLFAVFESRSMIRCAFVCKGEVSDKPAPDYVVVEHFTEPEAWTDYLLKTFNRGELAATPDRSRPEGEMWATMDGVGYLLRVATPDVRAALN